VFVESKSPSQTTAFDASKSQDPLDTEPNNSKDKDPQIAVVVVSHVDLGLGSFISTEETSSAVSIKYLADAPEYLSELVQFIYDSGAKYDPNLSIESLTDINRTKTNTTKVPRKKITDNTYGDNRRSWLYERAVPFR